MLETCSRKMIYQSAKPNLAFIFGYDSSFSEISQFRIATRNGFLRLQAEILSHCRIAAKYYQVKTKWDNRENLFFVCGTVELFRLKYFLLDWLKIYLVGIFFSRKRKECTILISLQEIIKIELKLIILKI